MRFFLCSLVVAGIVIPSLPARQVQGNKDSIEGTWKIVSYLNSGKDVTEKSAKITFIFKDGKYLVKEGDKTLLQGTYKLDPSKSPKWIDIINPEIGTFLGIYELEGDTLKICHGQPMGKERPTKFAS